MAGRVAGGWGVCPDLDVFEMCGISGGCDVALTGSSLLPAPGGIDLRAANVRTGTVRNRVESSTHL